MSSEKPYIKGKKTTEPHRYIVRCHTTVPKNQVSKFGPFKKGEYLGGKSLKTKNVNNACVFNRDDWGVGWFDTWGDGSCMGDYFEPLKFVISINDDSDKQ